MVLFGLYNLGFLYLTEPVLLIIIKYMFFFNDHDIFSQAEGILFSGWNWGLHLGTPISRNSCEPQQPKLRRGFVFYILFWSHRCDIAVILLICIWVIPAAPCHMTPNPWFIMPELPNTGQGVWLNPFNLWEMFFWSLLPCPVLVGIFNGSRKNKL